MPSRRTTCRAATPATRTRANTSTASGFAAATGCSVEQSSVPTLAYELSIEHQQHREVVLRQVSGWQSQARELDRCHHLGLAPSSPVHRPLKTTSGAHSCT